MEAIGALLLLLVFRVVSDNRAAFDVPVIGDLRDLFPGTARNTLLVYFCAFVGVFFVFRSVLLIFQTQMQYRTAYQTAADLSRQLMTNYLNSDYAFFLTRNSAELARTTWDAVNIVALFGFVPLLVSFSEVFIVLALLAVLTATAPALTLMAFLVTGGALAITFRFVHPRLRRIGETHELLSNRVFRLMQQSLGGARDVRLYQSETFFIDQLSSERDRMGRGLAAQATLSSAPRIVVEAVFAIFILLFVGVAALGNNLGAGTVALLGLFAYAALRTMPSINKISLAVSSLRTGASAIDTVTRDVNQSMWDVDMRRMSASVFPLHLERHIYIDDVSYRYPNHQDQVLEGVSLEIMKGQSVGLVGSTGAGKSTLVDIILGLLNPERGSVLVDDVDISHRVAEWQRSLGVVSQTVFLLDDSLRRNIAFGIADDDIDDARLAEAVSAAQLDEFVGSLPEGLETVVGERGARVSGGQRQRVAIARALYRQPEVVVFDEGTSALDSLTEADVMAALDNLRGDRTLIMVAHRLTTVRHCDQIVLLEAGRVVDTGTYDELLERSASFRQMAR
jgi:ATP-binding cassette subfamily C protein